MVRAMSPLHRTAAFIPIIAAPAAAETITTGSIGPICTDRPTKSNGACTVPKGYFQLEADLFGWTRFDSGPVRSDFYSYPSPTLKYGLTSRSDIQVTLPTYVEARTRAFGFRFRDGGFGDALVRYKHRFTDAGASTQVAAIPYVKVPVAERDIGNGEWEGGLIVPVSFELGGGTSLTLAPQLDIVADSDDPGDRHLAFQGVANIAFSVLPRTTLAAEIWTAQNFDPVRTFRQYSADAALTYLVNDDLQLDVGGNFGLNRLTPDVQLYLGVSKRF
jgi:hypothetical protein